MFTRRQLLTGGAALGGSLLVPGTGRAAVAPRDRKFLFVWVPGGWDPTKVFASSFAGTYDRAPSDEPATYGGLRLVANAERPAVDRFFSQHHRRVATLDGMLIRSINHPICRNLWMTDSPNANRPDWPSTIGHASAERYAVPHVLVQGFSMAGEYSAYTCLSGTSGQLDELLDGDAAATSDLPYEPPTRKVEGLIDALVAARSAARAEDPANTSAIAKHLTGSYREAAQRVIDFKDQTRTLELSVGTSLLQQIPLAMKLLSNGVARCVSIAAPGDWDTHIDNQPQGALFDGLFTGLNALMVALDATPGTAGGSLADETVVCAFSEMGRTPYLNSTGGKDHWMYSTALMWGAGVEGNQQIAGFDDYLNGVPIDLASGEPFARGVALTPDIFGSTLLTLAGLDAGLELGADTTLRRLLAT
jgi:uncharacterized protein (DUF1501 family)